MPRLFKENKFTAETVLPYDKFRFMLDKEGPFEIDEEKGKAAVRNAEKAFDAEIPVLYASSFALFQETGDRYVFEGPYHVRRGRLVSYSFAEKYEKKGRFVKKAIDCLYAIMEESTWVIPAHQWCIPTGGTNKLPITMREGIMHGIDLFAATTAAAVTTAYLCLKEEFDAISPIICDRIEYEIKRRILDPYLQIVFGWSGKYGGRPNNWNPWIISNVLFVASVFERNLEKRKAIAEKSMEYLDNFTAYYEPDGGCDEGPNYWNSAGASYYDAAEILYDMSGGKIDIFGEPLLRAMCEYEAKMFIDGISFMNFADCPPQIRNNGSHIRRMGERLGSDILVAFSETVNKYNPVSIEANHGYRVYRHMFDKSIASDSSIGFTKVWFPNLKVMAARENPETNKGMFVGVKGGNNDESHNHNDMGNMIVYYDGKPVFIDSGAAKYSKKTFSSERYTLWYMQSGYHNTVTVNGVMQKNGAKYRSTDECYDEKSGAVSMQLREAYPTEAGIKSLVREVKLVGGRVEVCDSVELCEEGVIDIHFLSAKKPEIDGRKILVAEDRVLTYPDALTAEVEEFEVDESMKSRWGSPVLYLIHLKATVKKGSFKVFIE